MVTPPLELLELARTIALEAGELAARRRGEGVEVAATKSTIVDVVTEADREVELLIRSRINDVRPDDAILGEEGGAASGTSGLTWVVDPIDGTVNYLYGIPHYAVSIAVVEGEPDPLTWTALAGCVLNPANGELFTAARGEGAFLASASGGPAPIRVAAPVPLELALINTGFAYNATTRGRQGGGRHAAAAAGARHPADGHGLARPVHGRERAHERLRRAHPEPVGSRGGVDHRARSRCRGEGVRGCRAQP